MNLFNSKNLQYLVEETIIENELSTQTSGDEQRVADDLDKVTNEPSLLNLRGKVFYDCYLSDDTNELVLKTLGKFVFAKKISFRMVVTYLFAFNYLLEPEKPYTLDDIFPSYSVTTAENNEKYVNYSNINMELFLKFRSTWINVVQKCKDIYYETDVNMFNKEYLEKYLPKVMAVSSIFSSSEL